MSKSILVIGGGPGGASCAYWLSRNGVEVHLVEKKRYPREKACGDGLTPRAIKQLLDMGFDFDGIDLHKVEGLRAYAGDLKIEMPWPDHSEYPDWGATMRRADLDGIVARMAEAEGAIAPIYSIADIFKDPQYAARETITTVEHPVLGPLKMPNVIPKMGKTPGRIKHPGAGLGEHNNEIFCGEFGVSETELAELVDRGVL